MIGFKISIRFGEDESNRLPADKFGLFGLFGLFDIRGAYRGTADRRGAEHEREHDELGLCPKTSYRANFGVQKQKVEYTSCKKAAQAHRSAVLGFTV